MAIALVQAASSQGTANANTQAVTVSSTGAGNLLIACMFDYNPGDIRTITGVSDGTNAFTQVSGAAISGDNGGVDMWILAVSSSGKTTITATFSGAAGTFFKEIAVLEISGFTSPVLDQIAKIEASTAPGLNFDGQGITIATAAEFIAAYCVKGDLGTNPTGGFTHGTNVGGDNLDYRITSATGTYTPGWTSGNVGNPYWNITASFKENTSGFFGSPLNVIRAGHGNV